jgi:hypothetical protein
VTLIADTESYAQASVLRMLSVRRRDSDDNDTPMQELSRQEYEDLPNKTSSSSIPVAWYFDPQQASGTLYVWPCPSSSAASDNTLVTTYTRRISDMDSSADSLDMPQEWLDAVIWLLADDLETEYPVNDARLANKIERKAMEAKQVLDYFDTESTSALHAARLCSISSSRRYKASKGRSEPWAGSRLINAFAEMSEGDKADLYSIQAIPGLTEFSDIGSLGCPRRSPHGDGALCRRRDRPLQHQFVGR